MKITDEHEKKRYAASDAVIALREALGKTQEAFAIEVLEDATATVALWESIDPPRGETLLRLRKIAEESGIGKPHGVGERFIDLADVFLGLYVEEVLAAVGGQLITFPERGGEPVYGYLLTRLNGEKQIAAAQSFISKL